MDCICISNLSNRKAILPVTCWTVFFWVVSLFCPREIECVFRVEAKIWLKCNLCVAFTVRVDLPGCIVAYDPFSVRGKSNTLSSFASRVLCSYPAGAANKSCIFTFVTELLLFLGS